MPNAVARNGAVRPWNESNHSRLRIVSTLAISVTSSGSMSVAMNTANTTRLNGKRRKTNA